MTDSNSVNDVVSAGKKTEEAKTDGVMQKKNRECSRPEASTLRKNNNCGIAPL
jgi:hypothetical protein